MKDVSYPQTHTQAGRHRHRRRCTDSVWISLKINVAINERVRLNGRCIDTTICTHQTVRTIFNRNRGHAWGIKCRFGFRYSFDRWLGIETLSRLYGFQICFKAIKFKSHSPREPQLPHSIREYLLWSNHLGHTTTQSIHRFHSLHSIHLQQDARNTGDRQAPANGTH